jgi:hypothetical protein
MARSPRRPRAHGLLLPITPRERLERLLDAFVNTDLEQINDAGITRLGLMLRMLCITSAPYDFELPRHLSIDVLRQVQSLLRSAFETLAGRRAYQRNLTAVHVTAEFVQPATPVRGTDHGLTQRFTASPPDVVLLVALELLRNTPASLLRRCPYRTGTGGRECSRVFVARKRQKWCSEHQSLVRQEQNRTAQEKLRRLRALRRQSLRRKR